MMNPLEFIVFGSPQITEEDINAVVTTMKSGWIGTGPKSHEFEKIVADYKQANFSVALNSCTAALHLALNNLNLSEDDEVITTTMTFCATVNAILHAGAKPVLVDCDPITFNIDPLKIEAAITPNTKAILPVHFAGYPCDMDAIMSIAKKYNLAVVEDCAHAIETQFNGKPVGTFGSMGCLSFYVTKNICTGEGGMVITNDSEIANRIRIQALHGMSKDAWKRFGDDGYKHYQVVEKGFKYNLTDMAAAMGIEQMKRITQNHNRRKDIFNRYTDAFQHLPLQLPADCPPQHIHGYHLYNPQLLLDPATLSRDALLGKLNDRKIGCGVHYRAVHLHPYYSSILDISPNQFPHANAISDRTFSIPISAKLSDDEVNYIIDTLQELLSI